MVVVEKISIYGDILKENILEIVCSCTSSHFQ